MGFSAVASAVAAAATVGGTAYSIDQSREAQDKQNEAAKKEQQQAAIENARRRRRAIAQQRIQQGQINNAGAVSNTIGSSGPQSAAGSLAGDVGTGLASFENQITANNQRLSFLSAASDAQANAQLGSTISQIGQTLGGTDWSQFGGGSDGGSPTTNSTQSAVPSGPPGQSFGYGSYRSGVTFNQIN